VRSQRMTKDEIGIGVLVDADPTDKAEVYE
jgi:hypothetical protein